MSAAQGRPLIDVLTDTAAGGTVYRPTRESARVREVLAVTREVRKRTVHNSPLHLWEALAARELIPAEWTADEHRLFYRVNSYPHELPTPAEFELIAGLACDPQGVLATEARFQSCLSLLKNDVPQDTLRSPIRFCWRKARSRYFHHTRDGRTRDIPQRSTFDSLWFGSFSGLSIDESVLDTDSSGRSFRAYTRTFDEWEYVVRPKEMYGRLFDPDDAVRATWDRSSLDTRARRKETAALRLFLETVPRINPKCESDVELAFATQYLSKCVAEELEAALRARPSGPSITTLREFWIALMGVWDYGYSPLEIKHVSADGALRYDRTVLTLAMPPVPGYA